MRPLSMLVIPPVEVAAARSPAASTATAPTVPPPVSPAPATRRFASSSASQRRWVKK